MGPDLLLLGLGFLYNPLTTKKGTHLIPRLLLGLGAATRFQAFAFAWPVLSAASVWSAPLDIAGFLLIYFKKPLKLYSSFKGNVGIIVRDLTSTTTKGWRRVLRIPNARRRAAR